jgi:hypothetical protein
MVTTTARKRQEESESLRGLLRRLEGAYGEVGDICSMFGDLKVTVSQRHRLARWVRRVQSAALGLADEFSAVLAELDE